MEREISLEELSKRYPEVEQDLPEGSMVEEPPSKTPSLFKRTVISMTKNVIMPLVIGLMLILTAPHISNLSSEWFFGTPAKAGVSP